MNKVILKGRLAKEPELRYSEQNAEMAILRCSIAVDRPVKKDKEKEVDFINILAFYKTAEFISKYFSKGSQILLVGRWQTGNYKKDDGSTVYTNDLMVNHCEILSSNSSNEDSKKETSSAESIDYDLPF